MAYENDKIEFDMPQMDRNGRERERERDVNFGYDPSFQIHTT